MQNRSGGGDPKLLGFSLIPSENLLGNLARVLFKTRHLGARDVRTLKVQCQIGTSVAVSYGNDP